VSSLMAKLGRYLNGARKSIWMLTYQIIPKRAISECLLAHHCGCEPQIFAAYAYIQTIPETN
jgi:hypothetical protein